MTLGNAAAAVADVHRKGAVTLVGAVVHRGGSGRWMMGRRVVRVVENTFPAEEVLQPAAGHQVVVVDAAVVVVPE